MSRRGGLQNPPATWSQFAPETDILRVDNGSFSISELLGSNCHQK